MIPKGRAPDVADALAGSARARTAAGPRELAEAWARHSGMPFDRPTHGAAKNDFVAGWNAAAALAREIENQKKGVEYQLALHRAQLARIVNLFEEWREGKWKSK